MYKVTSGPTFFCDVDDTLVAWKVPEGYTGELVEIICRGFPEQVAPNWKAVNHLKKMASRGHSVVVWSGGGSDWCEAVVKALELEEYIEVITSKPTYYMDDIRDPRKWIGKHSYISMDGKITRDNDPASQLEE